MNTAHNIVLRRLLIAVCLLSFQGGCSYSENEASAFFVQGNQAIDEKSNCELQSSGGAQVMRPFGVLDLSLANSYLLFPTVESNIPTTEEVNAKGASQLMTDSSTIQILGATVSYDVDPLIESEIAARTGAAIPDDTFVYTTGMVESGDKGLAAFEAIPSHIGELFRQATLIMDTPYAASQILARVTIEGQLQSGETVKSNEFIFPITLCNQCLLFYPVPDCTDLASDPEVSIPCFYGQDDAVDCRLCYTLAKSPADAEKCLAAPNQ